MYVDANSKETGFIVSCNFNILAIYYIEANNGVFYSLDFMVWTLDSRTTAPTNATPTNSQEFLDHLTSVRKLEHL